jgi:plasmid maintenance system antidote protein VapI
MLKIQTDMKLELASELLTKDELARILRISSATITNQMYQGREGIDLPVAIKIGRYYRWHRDSVAKFLKEKELERKSVNTSSEGIKLSKSKINRI